MSYRVAFHTLGCKVNQYETEALKEKFRQAGFLPVEEGEPCDVYVINTCTVTNLADRKSRQFIRRAVKTCPQALVVATGCYVQLNPEEAGAIEGVDLVVGTNEKRDIVRFVCNHLQAREETGTAGAAGAAGETGAAGAMESTEMHVLPYEQLNEYRSDGIIQAMEGRSRAFIKIEEGCDRFCSYCTIPFARGRVRSRATEEVLAEAEALIRSGFREIVLTGINTALYGTDLGQGGIAPLIRRLAALDGDFRIRLSSLEPTVVDAAYARELMDCDKLCHHMHLSLQSGSDAVLKRMNRRYTRDEFLAICAVLRAKDPYYGISSDIIVGFPGETEEEFRDSLELVRQAGIDKVHVFPYSRRAGTKAAAMPGQVPDAVKKERAARLAEFAEEIAAARRDAQVGSVRQVLFEEKREGGFLTGYTDNYIRVYAEAPAGAANIDLTGPVPVRLREGYQDGMKGVILC